MIVKDEVGTNTQTQTYRHHCTLQRPKQKWLPCTSTGQGTIPPCAGGAFRSPTEADDPWQRREGWWARRLSFQGMAAADVESAAPAKATLPECQGPQHQLEEPTSRKVGCTTRKQVKVATMWLPVYPCAQPSTPPTELRNTEHVVCVSLHFFWMHSWHVKLYTGVVPFFLHYTLIFMNLSLPFTFASHIVDQMWAKKVIQESACPHCKNDRKKWLKIMQKWSQKVSRKVIELIAKVIGKSDPKSDPKKCLNTRDKENKKSDWTHCKSDGKNWLQKNWHKIVIPLCKSDRQKNDPRKWLNTSQKMTTKSDWPLGKSDWKNWLHTWQKWLTSLQRWSKNWSKKVIE